MAQTHKNEEQLATAPIGRLMLKLAVPTVAAQLINMLYNIVDRIYIGHIPEVGSTALTGVGVTFPIITLVSAFAAFAGQGGAPLASIQLGAGRRDEAERILGNSLVLLLAASLLLTVGFSMYKEPILYAFGASDATIGYAVDYIRIYLLGTIFVQLALGLNSFISAQGKALVAMLSVLIGAILNIVLDPIFIFALDMGVRGAALATVLAQGVSAAGIALYGWRRVPLLRLERRHCKVSRGELGRIMNYSLLTCVQQSVMNFGILMVQGLVNSFGVNVMAAFAAAVKIDAFAYLPVQDFGNAFSTFVAQNTGAQKAERIRKGIRSALWVSVGFCLVSSLLVCLFAAPLMGLFVEPGETEIIAVGVEYLRIEGMCYCGIGILFLLYGLFRGLGRPGVSVVLTVVSLGTRVALAYLLAPIPAVGLKGIWWAVPIGWVLADLAGLVLYRRKPLPAETACAPEG